MAERIKVRRAELPDTQTILEIWNESVRDRTLEDTAKDVHRLMRRDPEALLVAEQKGRVVGTLIAVWDGWRGSMYRLAVLPDRRRQGIASALVEEGERRLIEHGCRRVTALLMGEREDAVGLWRSVGYKHDPKVQRFVKNLD